MIVLKRRFPTPNCQPLIKLCGSGTGCHTQNIELLRWQIKRSLPDTFTRHEQLYLHLAKYLWRNMKRDSGDLFKEFLLDAAKYFPG